MSKRRCSYWLRSSSKRQKTEERSSKKEIEIDEINKLPDQILVIIFELVSAKERICIERVCKRWNILSQCAWSKFQSFNFKEKNLCELLVKQSEVAKILFSRGGKWLKSVSIDDSPVRYNLLSIFSKYCPNLETVDFTGARLSKYKSFLKNFSISCCKLKSVSFDDCFPEANIDAEFGDFFVNCPYLTSLKLINTSKLTGICFANLPQHLKQLDLSECSGLEDEGFRFIRENCCNLEVLRFDYCSDKITSSCFESVCEKLTKLQVLDLNNFEMHSLQDINLSKALSNMSLIRELHLYSNYWVTDETLDIISRALPNIQVLNLSHCSNVSNVGLSHISRLQYLSELDLGIVNITDIGVTMLAHQLRQLEKLDLSWCDVSDKSVIELAQWCSNLKVLNLCGCWHVTDVSIQAFYNNVDRRTAVLTLKVFGTNVSSKHKSAAAKKKLQQLLLSIEYFLD